MINCKHVVKNEYGHDMCGRFSVKMGTGTKYRVNCQYVGCPWKENKKIMDTALVILTLLWIFAIMIGGLISIIKK